MKKIIGLYFLSTLLIVTAVVLSIYLADFYDWKICIFIATILLLSATYIPVVKIDKILAKTYFDIIDNNSEIEYDSNYTIKPLGVWFCNENLNDNEIFSSFNLKVVSSYCKRKPTLNGQLLISDEIIYYTEGKRTIVFNKDLGFKLKKSVFTSIFCVYKNEKTYVFYIPNQSVEYLQNWINNLSC